MADNLEELEGKPLEELDTIIRQEDAKLSKLRMADKSDFGKGGPELKPVTDEEVKQVIEDLDRAIKVRHIADQRQQLFLRRDPKPDRRGRRSVPCRRQGADRCRTQDRAGRS